MIVISEVDRHIQYIDCLQKALAFQSVWVSHQVMKTCIGGKEKWQALWNAEMLSCGCGGLLIRYQYSTLFKDCFTTDLIPEGEEWIWDSEKPGNRLIATALFWLSQWGGFVSDGVWNITDLRRLCPVTGLYILTSFFSELFYFNFSVWYWLLEVQECSFG